VTDPEPVVDNLRNARREARAARRALGADAVEETGMATAMPRKKVRALPVAEARETVVVEETIRQGYTRKGYKAKDGQSLYEATGSSGQICVRGSANEMTVGIDVIDLAGSNAVAKAGQVWKLFATTAQAEQAAVKLREQGYAVKIVPARPYAGQPNDPE